MINEYENTSKMYAKFILIKNYLSILNINQKKLMKIISFNNKKLFIDKMKKIKANIYNIKAGSDLILKIIFFIIRWSIIIIGIF